MIIPSEAPTIKLDEQLKKELLAQIREEGMVIVHCSYTAEYWIGIRIWNSTFLIDAELGNRSRMLHAFNIPIAPKLMEVPAGSTVRFTLIFAPLPKTCEIFDLLEDIPEARGFHIRGIKRNKSDVYRVTIG
jgi:hypothetical protein